MATALLPMWRSPTGSCCSSVRSRRGGTALHQDSWDDDEAAQSPTRVVQCLNFLAQVERVHVREPRRRLRDPVLRLDVYLTEGGGVLPDQPTYYIERSLAEFTQLRDEIVYWTTRKHKTPSGGGCVFCARFQSRSAAWDAHWPRRLLARLFPAGVVEAPLQTMLNDALELARSQLRFGDDGPPCAALEQLPARLTAFLVQQELYMEE